MKNICFILLMICTNLSFAAECDYQSSVVKDFDKRDKLTEYTSTCYHDNWGPKPRLYMTPRIPADCDPVLWQRQRIIAVAEKYIGLPYKHHHTPSYNDGSGVGLDCSNFTAWVYNYGLGIKLDSDITMQSLTAGRELAPDEALQPGDLLFIRTENDSRISHVVIYVDAGHIIDDHADGVKIRDFKGWYKNHFAYARRIIE